jgi:hypothetical protein
MTRKIKNRPLIKKKKTFPSEDPALYVEHNRSPHDAVVIELGLQKIV